MPVHFLLPLITKFLERLSRVLSSILLRHCSQTLTYNALLVVLRFPKMPYYKNLHSVCNYHFTFLLVVFNLVDQHSPWTFHALELAPYPSFSVPLFITSHLLISKCWRTQAIPLLDSSLGDLIHSYGYLHDYRSLGMPSLEYSPEYQFHEINYLLNILS